MGADTITVTEEQVEQARKIVLQSAETFGLDLNDGNLLRFLELQAQNKAASMAWDLFNTGIIQKVTIEGHWSPGGCKHVHVDVDS